MGMLILFYLANIFSAAAIDGFSTSEITEKQPFAFTKVELTVDGAAKDLKSSGITVFTNPGCYQTIIKGKNAKGFAANSVLNLSYWADKAFTTASNNSVYTIQAPKSLTYVEPTGDDSSKTVGFEIPQGTTEFCILIQQNPYISVVNNSTATPPQLDISAENLADVAVRDISVGELTPAATIPMSFATATDKSYSSLIYTCAKDKFRKCLESAVIDCSDKIDKGIANIIWCHKLKQLRCLIAEKCKKVQVCPQPQPQPMPCPPPQPHPTPQPAPHPVPYNPCPQVTPITPFVFLDICIRATILLGECAKGNSPVVYNLAPHYGKPYHQYITECDRLLFAGQAKVCVKAQVSTKAQQPVKKTEEKKKKKTTKSDKEEEEKSSGFSTGTYIAGGVGAVVVVSVCVYVGYQFLS